MAVTVSLNPVEEALAGTLPQGEVTDAFRAQGLPTRRDEAWKWSDLRLAAKAIRTPSLEYQGDLAPLSALAALEAERVVIANGRLVEPGRAIVCDRSPDVWPVTPLASLATVVPTVGLTLDGDNDTPVLVDRLSDGDGYHADRLKVTLARGARATLVEVHWAVGASFSNCVTEIEMEEGASLTRIVVQPAAIDALTVHTSLIRQAADSQLNQTSILGGAAFARHETRTVFEGTASAQIDALYRLSGDLMTDVTTHVDHQVPGCETSELIKGVIDERARGVFQGKFHVARPAQQTNATMAHHALLLSDDASVNAKPELEIYADDVECAHGNTAGALDDDTLFYLRQRGLSADQARRLLIDAFGAEVLERVEDESLREALTELYGGLNDQ